MLKRSLFILSIFLGTCFVYSCTKEVTTETQVYKNDLESGDLTYISSGIIETFNGSKVLGRYNDGGFDLRINDLPSHDLIEISFDLYIHDSWDGNRGDDNGTNGPDIWKMIIEGNTYINTTFSNSDCGTTTFCNPQSYPYNYLNNNNNPKTGAFRRDLPGVCLTAGQAGGTSQYRIVKRINHDSNSLQLSCLDKLVQTNAASAKCDESWSVDNIVIKAIKL